MMVFDGITKNFDGITKENAKNIIKISQKLPIIHIEH